MLNIKRLIISFFDKKASQNVRLEMSSTKKLETPKDDSIDNVYEYNKKTFYMSQCERNFYQKLMPLKNAGYNIETQINLSTVIQKCYKDSGFETKYRNELFRNIDYGIFTADYQLLLLIELNDATHSQRERKLRDQRVYEICKKANIKLLTFYTSMPNNSDYVLNRINKAIKEVLNLEDKPYVRVIKSDDIVNEDMINKIDYQKKLQRIRN